MNPRQRFFESLHYGSPDRLPYFEEGIRADTLAAWQAQGNPAADEFAQRFPSDERTEIKFKTEPAPPFERWPATFQDLTELEKRLDSTDFSRISPTWPQEAARLSQRDHVLMLRPHEGLFLSMGVGNAATFTRLMYQLADQPDFVSAIMQIQGQFAARLTEQVLQNTTVDALIFSEPIGDNNGALISPKLYQKIVLPSYQPLLDLAARYGVKTIICRTYANMKALIPSLLDAGIDCLWACEVEPTVMNYPALRREFGRDLKLIGGIDLDALRDGPAAINRAIDNIAPLIAAGGFIPLADGRVRADVPYKNYVYYRSRLRDCIAL